MLAVAVENCLMAGHTVLSADTWGSEAVTEVTEAVEYCL